jgi:RNA polymerase sigma factor (sigma-70 family)
MCVPMTQVASKLDDRELICLYQEGKEWAFAELLNRHKNRIYTAIYLIVRNEETAHDLFQDTFIKIVGKLRGGQYNDEGKFAPWALRVAHNMAVDYLRKCKSKSAVNLDLNDEPFRTIEYSGDNGEQSIVRSQTHDMLIKYLDNLPFEQREVVVLRHYADLSFKEIADLTGVNMSTALGRMRYALVALRAMLHADENTDAIWG